MNCTKRSFINKHEAKIMLQSTKESPSKLRKEVRSYKCDKCRCYHLTSQTIEEYEAEKLNSHMRVMSHAAVVTV